MAGKTIACCILCVLLSGCGGRRLCVPPLWQKSDVSTSQARLSDVALPLNTTPLTHPGRMSLVYTTKTAPDELIPFYEHEMERLGWVALGAAHADEAILVFEKPSRLCVVSVRNGANTHKHAITRSRASSLVRIDVINSTVSMA